LYDARCVCIIFGLVMHDSFRTFPVARTTLTLALF
jgi:hypothetical protein